MMSKWRVKLYPWRKSQWEVSSGPMMPVEPYTDDLNVHSFTLIDKQEFDTALEALKQTIAGIKNQLEPHVFEGLPYKQWRENVLTQLSKAEFYLNEKLAEDVASELKGNC